MTLSKFLTYWSLTFAILVIWIFSVAVAMADAKDDLLQRLRKQRMARLRAHARPIDPLVGRSVAETLTPSAMDEKESWVFHLVSSLAIALRLDVRVLVLQDSMGHYLVHFTQGRRLITYRVDKTWVADAMAGKGEARERINKAVEQYLRQEFLGQKPVPAAPTPAGPAQGTQARPAAPGSVAAQKPAPGTAGQAGAAAPAAGAGGAEMSREEKIAAARAKAEAIKAQRAAAGAATTQPAPSTSSAASAGAASAPKKEPGSSS
jgi:hypothetical protein